MQNIISITNLTKTYASGFQALKNVQLDMTSCVNFVLRVQRSGWYHRN